ncbi:MAG: hypothetical protein E3J87_05670 [Candidatus Cloacimonadota bacterium]|nr:MAG: hypothetical protein E3J87_05670 [Candidatus Cloacimonadota bacterium]
MMKKAMMISDDPSFAFMMTTIIDQLELHLLSIEKKDNLWEEIREKNPNIVIWDFDGTEGTEKIGEKFHTYIPEDCHLLLFSNAISGLTHFKNGRLHLFEKPFSPNEISHLIKEITN